MPTRGSSPDLLALNIDEELLRALETKEWGRPLALGTVVREAVERKEMMPLTGFVDARESIYHKSWAISPWDILGWGLRQLGLAGGQSGEDKLPVGKLVVLANMEEAAREVARRSEGMRGRVERIFSKALFGETFRDVLGKEKGISDGDLELLLKFLQRDKSLIAYDGATVKLKAWNEATAPRITSEDATIASLKSLIKDLEIQTMALTKRVDELGITAKEAVAKKNRVSALAALRSKKLAETTLTKRHATLGQLEEVFASIEQAADQVELVKVMEASSRVLSGLNKEVGGVDRVDDVVDQLREQMSQVDEIGNVIAESGQGTGVIDETEVDDELEAMERDDREKREEKERLNREEKEKQEAIEIRRKLDALEEIERQATLTKEAARKNAEQESGTEKEVEESTREMKRMSLEDQGSAHIPA